VWNWYAIGGVVVSVAYVSSWVLVLAECFRAPLVDEEYRVISARSFGTMPHRLLMGRRGSSTQ
jgi:hypothetical protein